MAPSVTFDPDAVAPNALSTTVRRVVVVFLFFLFFLVAPNALSTTVRRRVAGNSGPMPCGRAQRALNDCEAVLLLQVHGVELRSRPTRSQRL